jgi:hypothetical protein
VMMHRIGMHGEVGYLVFRHRQTNANPRSRGKWRQNACVCVCVRLYLHANVNPKIVKIWKMGVTFQIDHSRDRNRCGGTGNFSITAPGR